MKKGIKLNKEGLKACIKAYYKMLILNTIFIYNMLKEDISFLFKTKEPFNLK